MVPRTLTGRVLLVILAGLAVALTASIAFFVIERERAVERWAAEETAARILEIARLPASASAAANQPGPGRGRQRIRWHEVDSAAPQPSGGEPSHYFASEVHRLLADGLGKDPVLWITSRETRRPEPGEDAASPPSRPATVDSPDGARVQPPDEARRSPPSGPRNLRERPPIALPFALDRSFFLITVALQLPGGRNAIAEATLFQPSLQIPVEAWASVALIFLVTAAFSMWAVRIAVRPLRMLGGAAERLSRNIDEPPLPEGGADDIRAATRAFNRMQDRLRRHVNSRALAFAAMSHDMRTPLTRLRLRLESLDERSRDKISGDLHEIEQLSQSTLELIRGLAPGEEMEVVDVATLVRRIAEDCAAMGCGVRVAGRCAPVRCRPIALRRVLVNLIDNACKYGEDVAVELSDAEGEAVIAVTDRGPGIPPEHLDRVVYPFYRVEPSRNRESGGTGLGLAIAKDVVEGHGGTLALANRAGGGLEVTVRIPR